MNRSRTRCWRALALLLCTAPLPALAEKPDPGQPSQGASFIEEFAARRDALAKIDPDMVMVCERQPCVLREDLDGDGKPDEVLQVMHRKSFAPGVAVISSRGATRVLGADKTELELSESLQALRFQEADVDWGVTAGDAGEAPRVFIGGAEAIQFKGARFVRIPQLGGK